MIDLKPIAYLMANPAYSDISQGIRGKIRSISPKRTNINKGFSGN